MKASKMIEPIQEAAKILPPADAPCLPEQIPAWLDDIPSRVSREGDSACREYSKHGKWPVLDDLVRAEVHLRLLMADHFVHGMKNTTIPSDTVDDAWEFLLVQIWRDLGHSWARSRFLGQPHFAFENPS